MDDTSSTPEAFPDFFTAEPPPLLPQPPFPLQYVVSDPNNYNSFSEGPGGDVGGGGDSAGIDVEAFRSRIWHFTSRVDELEQKVNEVSQFYSTKQQQDLHHQKKQPQQGSKEKLGGNVHKKQQNKEASCTKRMQELMRQFGTILRQISQDKWAWPFMEPVDVEGLGLDDYYQIIEKPMDFGTIRNKMEAKDGTGYKNVREIYADVRLVFANAMTYNEEEHDVHCMAKKLSVKFEEKWLQLLPKITEEETRQKEEEKAHIDVQISKDVQVSKDVAFAKIARDTSNELTKLSAHLDELREMVIKNCRKISTEEKRRILCSFSKLPPEQINRALEMIGQQNPNFPTPEVLIDMDAQTESTLWRLKSCINSLLKGEQNTTTSVKSQDNTKRKRELSDALVKNAKKRIKKL